MSFVFRIFLLTDICRSYGLDLYQSLLNLNTQWLFSLEERGNTVRRIYLWYLKICFAIIITRFKIYNVHVILNLKKTPTKFESSKWNLAYNIYFLAFEISSWKWLPSFYFRFFALVRGGIRYCAIFYVLNYLSLNTTFSGRNQDGVQPFGR